MTHLPEPWSYDNELEGVDIEKEEGNQMLHAANGEWVVSACSCCDAVNARPVDMIRLVLCVNYCAGLSNEELEKGRKDDH